MIYSSDAEAIHWPDPLYNTPDPTHPFNSHTPVQSNQLIEQETN